MKIVIIAPSARAVATKRADLIRTLQQAGAEVLVILPTLDVAAFEWAYALIPAEYRKVHMIRGGLNPLDDWRTQRELTAILREVRPDIVFNFAVKPTIFGTFAARRAGVPRVVSMVTGAGYLFGPNPGLKQRLLQALALPLYRRAGRANAAMIFQNRDDRQLFIDLGIVPDPDRAVVVNGSGVNLDEFSPSPPPQDGKLRFIMLSRLIAEKGIKELAEATAALATRHPDRFESLHLGTVDPQSYNRISDTAPFEAQGLQFKGFQTNVAQWLAESSVFVLPSYYPEGIPRAGIEALAIGRPVISTDAPGCRELVIDGENGFLIPPRDAGALRDAMERFITDPTLIPRMGAASQRIAQERFDVRKVNADMRAAIMGEAAPR